MNRPLSASSVRLGAIAFINTIPVYHGLGETLLSQGVELVYDVPARLNRAMAEERLQVSPVSSAYYLQNKDQLVLLEDLSVSSPGAVESVIFLSRTPLGPELLDVPVIAVPDDSETSVFLLAHLIRQKTGQDMRPWFKVYPASDYITALQETGSALIIGDNALLIQRELRAGQMGEYYCYDLSTLWLEETGLPFVFAVWVADRAWAGANPQERAWINQTLVNNRERFFNTPGCLEEGVALAASRCKIPSGDIRHYFAQALSYVLREPHLQSLVRFEAAIQSLTPTRESQTREAQRTVF